MDNNLVDRFSSVIEIIKNENIKPTTDNLYSPVLLTPVGYDFKFQLKVGDLFYVLQEINPTKD